MPELAAIRHVSLQRMPLTVVIADVKFKVLIIGCGSIGERHLRCFQRTGRAEPTACEVNPSVLQRIRDQYQVAGFASLDDALASTKFDAAVVCTPADTHIPVAIKLIQQGMHVLIEKPLSTSLDQVDALKAAIAASGKFCGVGYTYHFMPGLQKMREALRSGRFGKPLQVVVTAGQHFPTFRPAYREIYYARHEAGGGAIQDLLTHFANAIEWIVGPMTRVYCQAAHQMLEGVTVEDTVCLTANSGDVLVSCSVNQFQPPNESIYQINCEHGSLKYELHEQRWAEWPRGAETWQFHAAPIKERDDIFVAQASAFLDGMTGKPTDLCTVDEAAQTLKVNLANLASWRTGQPVELQK